MRDPSKGEYLVKESKREPRYKKTESVELFVYSVEIQVVLPKYKLFRPNSSCSQLIFGKEFS